MLVEFSVKNFRSIKDKVTLSLVASSEDTHPENTFTDPSGKVRLLKSAAIYGANASGKSNIIEAINTMRNFIRKSHKQQRGDKIDVIPFRLDPLSVSCPSEFEVVFIKDDLRYTYGFSADQERVHEEWLMEADLSGQRVFPRRLFQRELQQDGKYKWAFGEHWKPKIRDLENTTLENALYFSLAVKSNHHKASIIFDWFLKTLRSISGEPEGTPDMAFTIDLCETQQNIKLEVLAMMKDADLGIEDFSNRKEPLVQSREWLKMPEDEQKQILTELGEDTDKIVLQKIITKHLMTDGVTSADFDLMDDESHGTQRIFSLAGPVIHSMKNGNIIFCDELDSSLHPMLSRALIDMVHKHSDPPFQFIFTTHDCALLDSDLFRRDQIWFTEKDNEMATKLSSLWDIKIKPRSDENFRKGYLSGRYGAIPFLGEFNF